MERSVAFYTALGYEVLGQVRPAETVSLTMLKLPYVEFVSLELVHDRGHARVISNHRHLQMTVDLGSAARTPGHPARR